MKLRTDKLLVDHLLIVAKICMGVFVANKREQNVIKHVILRCVGKTERTGHTSPCMFYLSSGDEDGVIVSAMSAF